MLLALRFVLVGCAVLAVGAASAAEPPLGLTDDGSMFVYRVRPGDDPSSIAAMFKIGDVGAFLAANGIADPTRIPVGHVFRVPNPLAVRATAAEQRAETAEHELAGIRGRLGTLERELASARTEAAAGAERTARLSHLERLWLTAQAIGSLLVVLVVGAAGAAAVALRKKSDAEGYARVLAAEVDEKRQAALAERQHAARRILDLESRLRELERQLARATTPMHRPTGTH
jgi:hypothetical protein